MKKAQYKRATTHTANQYFWGAKNKRYTNKVTRQAIKKEVENSINL